MNFELPNWTQAKINSVNNRSEKHGPDALEAAVDLGISIEQPNACLSEFHGALLSSLYFRSGASVDPQAELDGVEMSSLPNLRFTKLGLPLKWDDEGTGYRLEIDHGLGDKSNVELTGCKVNEFRLTPKEGGTVELKFRVQCAEGLTEKTLGKLGMLVQHTVPILLLAPDGAGQQQTELQPTPSGGDDEDPNDELTPERALAGALETA